MLRKFFIPLTLALIAVAAVFYFFEGRNLASRSLRDAVPVEHFSLRNGLQVVVMRNNRIPAVTHMLYVKAGGADDPYGKSGLAHYLEHLMFSGTAAFPEGTYERAVQKFGGMQNAMTTRDFTLYYASVPKAQLSQVMAMESDRLSNINVNVAAARELKVITEERNMRVENNSDALLAEQLDAITLLNHPYRQPIIGWAEDMASFTGEDAAAFFAKNYAPSNMVLLVAGDVEVSQVRKLAQQYYGNLPARAAPDRVWPKEPPSRLMRQATMMHPNVQTPRLLRQYVAPSVQHGNAGEAMPLWLMAQYLGGSKTSILYQSLVVQQKLASSVDIDFDPLYRGPAMLRIQAVAAPGVELAQLEQALDRVLMNTLKELPPQTDVARAKTQVEAAMIFAQDGLTPLAQLIGKLVMLDLDENYFYGWQEQIRSITPEQMLAAAQHTLVPSRQVTGYLLPEEKDKNAALPAAVISSSVGGGNGH
jgi:zinc protease